MGQRNRKRGQRQKRVAMAPTVSPPASPRARATSEERNAAVRATLAPLAPGERPWVIKAGALLAFLSGAVQLVLYLAGVKLKVAGAHPQAGSTIVFAALMFVCAVGTWLMRYWAVLGLMALLALLLLFFSLALITASSLAGFAIAIGGVGIAGVLFYKLVRVLSRIQMPKYPGR